MLGHQLETAGYNTGYAGQWHVGPLELPAEETGFEKLSDYNDEHVTEASVEFLLREHEDPFLLVAMFDNPHNICEWAIDHTLPWGPIEEVQLEDCPPLPSNFHPPAFEPSSLRRSIEDDARAQGAMLDASPEEWRRYRHAYFRLIEKVDAQIGRLLDALEANGLMDTTLVIFTSDHGDHNGAHQCSQKRFLYEESVRVPLIAAGPGIREGATDDRLVSTGLDLLRTFCDYADHPVRDDLPGRSLRPLLEDRSGTSDIDSDSNEMVDPEWRDYIVVQTYEPLEGRAVRTHRYKYIAYEFGRGREQLFDLQEDPGEMVDLSECADYADVLAAHRERLLEWCVETGDVFGEHWERPGIPMIPGYEYRELPQVHDST